ncbi:Uncharacterised protein [Mycobacteroides abscessus subsp. massiliense]|nr:Uncharacterised protein [Mycobacteroides abscessus subsp. massiliense]
MPGQVLREMAAHRDGPDARTASAVRDAEGLVQVQVAHIATEMPRAGKPHKGVQVRTVHVHLSPGIVHGRADVGDVVLVDTVGGRVGDHDRGQRAGIGGDLRTQIVQVDVTVLPAGHHHDPHAGQCRRGGVGAVGARRDQAHIATRVAAIDVVLADGQQTRVFAL